MPNGRPRERATAQERRKLSDTYQDARQREKLRESSYQPENDAVHSAQAQSIQAVAL